MAIEKGLRLDMTTLNEKINIFNSIYGKLSDFEKKDWEENFLVEFTHDSTSIEGNTLTLIDTKMILTDGIIPAETSVREYEEIKGHANAWEFVKKSVQDKIPLTENMIKDIHEKVVPMAGIGGIYRNIPVYIRGANHVPPDPRRVWDYMKNFTYRMEHDSFHNPIEKAAWIHAEFVKIHPFQDGNGRTARLIMNYTLLENGYPPTSIKKDNVQAYFQSLETYAMKNNLKPFTELLQKNMEKELDSFIKIYAIYYDKDINKKLERKYINRSKNHHDFSR